jgi:hypothetical protein
MRWIGRLFLVAFGLLLALGASGLFFLAASVLDPVMASLSGETLFAGFWSLLDAIFAVDDPAFVMEGAIVGLGQLAFTLFVVPLVFIALVSEVVGARSLVWHAGATGLLTAAIPWLLRGNPEIASSAELHVSAILGTTGAVAGLVYWAVAGRSAGGEQPPAHGEDAPP